ncbi:MAG: hypothetical protein UU73_C0002G0148 [Candidatus Daviesbacteria bacterium GW2011_GWA1_41_61]|uniref:Uncharacterized protein n=1 Tax=Candidatus Daviesbacteria bacterium GW2011_GWA2_40_9 TaxID=1618424 RepID=A0A0G0U832_9BACT|nr:MAG: hypothetical protein UU26_C0009G0054 [Candidatus Daviesbacteria bacterium GW2011_GWC1_40_9]KKR83426.1 MAG: hypothetical protein UU29_C0005G0007 [Candidatus Daviesbacteria bacterium GW2011_GWA2_40_9]KKR93808.1 MAG: hypothetical protein UU44_C0001G0148 [Candidatus Daviesbacteria bacterium GW2011_GWB1_41_15]KKS15274.1 MAG: hypothetical protein UU73_C0002G0148 [Candidatus Daviesbacteria bacterium GW2011_GWA1_41_61]
MPLSEIAYLSILGKPLIFYLGILTYLLFVFTAILGYSNFRGRPILPFIWHPRIAAAALILATIHGLLALSVYFF